LKVLIVYDSRTGNTEQMAFAVAKGIEKNGLEAVLRKVEEASVDELPKVQALILGSPVYYG
jgi:NAD(P)H dehydrogenase (quinone)